MNSIQGYAKNGFLYHLQSRLENNNKIRSACLNKNVKKLVDILSDEFSEERKFPYEKTIYARDSKIHEHNDKLRLTYIKDNKEIPRKEDIARELEKLNLDEEMLKHCRAENDVVTFRIDYFTKAFNETFDRFLNSRTISSLQRKIDCMRSAVNDLEVLLNLGAVNLKDDSTIINQYIHFMNFHQDKTKDIIDKLASIFKLDTMSIADNELRKAINLGSFRFAIIWMWDDTSISVEDANRACLNAANNGWVDDAVSWMKFGAQLPKQQVNDEFLNEIQKKNPDITVLKSWIGLGAEPSRELLNQKKIEYARDLIHCQKLHFLDTLVELGADQLSQDDLLTALGSYIDLAIPTFTIEERLTEKPVQWIQRSIEERINKKSNNLIHWYQLALDYLDQSYRNAKLEEAINSGDHFAAKVWKYFEAISTDNDLSTKGLNNALIHDKLADAAGFKKDCKGVISVNLLFSAVYRLIRWNKLDIIEKAFELKLFNDIEERIDSNKLKVELGEWTLDESALQTAIENIELKLNNNDTVWAELLKTKNMRDYLSLEIEHASITGNTILKQEWLKLLALSDKEIEKAANIDATSLPFTQKGKSSKFIYLDS